MTDRELLEAAARAAGGIPVPLVWIRPFDDELTPINNRGEPWNPLTDDGDALRLAVKLGISIDPYPIYTMPKHGVLTKQRRPGDMLRESNPTYRAEVYDGDPCAATRRAIVRAAAAIGAHKEGA